MAWGDIRTLPPDVAPDAFTPVSEYVPDYANTGATGPVTIPTASMGDAERVQRFLVEVQRSSGPVGPHLVQHAVGGLRVYAGQRSAETGRWLGREIGQAVTAINL
jgi:MSHA biogenesis protein MshI